MLHNTSTDLQRTRFALKSLMDDGKTTMVFHKLSENDIYIMPNSSVYYRLEKEEFKDKAYLVINYHDDNDLTIYASKSTPRPYRLNNDLVLNAPRVIFFNNQFFEEAYLYLGFQSCK